ncbi:MAG: hypothetical protein K2P61_11895 [Burkholderiaceae bacterium]|nr:hypothetical protein [Burkholderiaceae bacterium]
MRNCSTILATIFVTASCICLTACVSSYVPTERTEVILPLNRAWVDARKVEYVTTDISDVEMAKMAGVNYVPRLADAVPRNGAKSLLERVYKFPGGEQISIFQSTPLPTGAANADINYSPLWRIVLVRWLKRDKLRELTSEADVHAAEDAGEVSLQVTDIVANCPVVRGTDGQSLKGAR